MHILNKNVGLLSISIICLVASFAIGWGPHYYTKLEASPSVAEKVVHAFATSRLESYNYLILRLF